MYIATGCCTECAFLSTALRTFPHGAVLPPQHYLFFLDSDICLAGKNRQWTQSRCIECALNWWSLRPARNHWRQDQSIIPAGLDPICS